MPRGAHLSPKELPTDISPFSTSVMTGQILVVLSTTACHPSAITIKKLRRKKEFVTYSRQAHLEEAHSKVLVERGGSVGSGFLLLLGFSGLILYW